MVPTAPPAHAGEAQVEYHWLGKLARWLELGREKVAILVEEASPGGLRPLISMLMEREPPVVCFHATDLLDVPVGSLVVLTLHEAELNWLNLNRPIIATKRLRLVLWLEFPLYRLKATAPDFFDWISHVVRCPRLPPQFTVRRLRDARAAQCAIAWRGKALDAALDRIGEGLVRIEARGTFEQLVSALEKAGARIPVWTAVYDTWHLLRVELAMQQARRSWWIVEHPGRVDPRYAAVDDQTLSWEDATERLGPAPTVADRSTAACIAALVEADPQGVESLALARCQGQSFDETLARIRAAPDHRPVDPNPVDRAPGPTFAEALRRHARALHSDRTGAWVAAADCARVAGHADVARFFGERALAVARSEARRCRAKLALAAAERDAGAYGQAHAHFFELVEALDSAPQHDPRLAVVLTEQACLLAHEQQHAAAADDVAQAIEIWQARRWRPLDRVHLQALGIHARCLAAQGRGSDLSEGLAQRTIHWPLGERGELALALARARSGDRDALERVAQRMRHCPPEPSVETIGLELAGLQLAQASPGAVVASCVCVLRSLRASHGTDLHPHGVDARLLIGKALAPRDPRRARRFLQRALDDCEIIHDQAPHRRTLQVVICLAEVERQRGDLAAATALAARAGAIEHAIESSAWDALETDGPTDPTSARVLVPNERLEALLSELDTRDTGLGDRSDLHRLAGDVQALEMFMARETPRLMWFFARRGITEQDARDLVQDTLLELMTVIRHEPHVTLSPQMLLQRIASGRLHKQWERGRRSSTQRLPELDALAPLQQAQAASDDIRLDVERILDQLPFRQRSVVELHLTGRSSREIADTLGIHEQTVRSLQRRALRWLRQQWLPR